MKKDIVIVGAGLVGSLLSIYLARRGNNVRIFERRSDMRKEKTEAGRSINLALSDRGLLALEKIGISEEIRSISIPMHGRSIHNKDGSTAFQPYGKTGQFINSVSRATLNKKLMDLAEKVGIEIHFSHRLVSADWKKNELTFQTPADSLIIHADLVFGADGAYSAARLQHQLQSDRFDYHQYYIDCGYKELTIPATPAGDFALEPNALHIWPRGAYMLIALPNLDHTFTCTLFFPFEGELSFSNLDSKEKIQKFFSENFSDVIELMPDYTEAFLKNPVSPLVTVKCFPWIHKDRFALIGDAAHAIVPFFGQGMNCGFEDCRILDELVSMHENDWEKILTEYQSSRKPDADAIADMAINNFTEMREKTADASFLLQKKIEAKLHEKYPDRWVPAYSMVTFSPGIRYSEAKNKGLLQENVMREFMMEKDIEEKWDNDDLHNDIIKRLKQEESKL